MLHLSSVILLHGLELGYFVLLFLRLSQQLLQIVFLIGVKFLQLLLVTLHLFLALYVHKLQFRLLGLESLELGLISLGFEAKIRNLPLHSGQLAG